MNSFLIIYYRNIPMMLRRLLFHSLPRQQPKNAQINNNLMRIKI